MRDRRLAPWVTRTTDAAGTDRAWARTQRRLVWDARRGWVLTAALALFAVGAAYFVSQPTTPSGPRVVSGPSHATLRDGSTLELQAATSVTVVREDEPVELTLEQGDVTFDAAHRSVWHVGPLELRVSPSTRVVVRRGAAPELLVERGEVELLDESGVVRRLTAGERWPKTPTAEVPAPQPTPEPAPVAIEPTPAPPTKTPREKTVPLTPPTRDTERLYTDFLEARRDQRWGELEAAARRFLARAPGDSRAGVVEFELGRVLMDRLARPHDAALSLAHALAREPDANWAEDALARLATASAQAGDGPGCQAARRRYLETFPQGRRAQAVQQACEP